MELVLGEVADLSDAAVLALVDRRLDDVEVVVRVLVRQPVPQQHHAHEEGVARTVQLLLELGLRRGKKSSSSTKLWHKLVLEVQKSTVSSSIFAFFPSSRHAITKKSLPGSSSSDLFFLFSLAARSIRSGT